MPRTRYHAKIEQDRKLKEQSTMTTESTNGNGQALTTANLNKLASAIGAEYKPEPLNFQPLAQFGSTMEQIHLLAGLLGSNVETLINLILTDTFNGTGERTQLLKLIASDLKNQKLTQQRLLLEEQKQNLLSEVSALDKQLTDLTGAYAHLKSHMG